MSCKQNAAGWVIAIAISCAFLPSLANAADTHPLMSSKYWVTFGAYFAARDLDVSASVAIGEVKKRTDFETSAGLDDKPDLLNVELGWRFGEKWDLSFQRFRSERKRSVMLEESIEWEDVIYEVGADIAAKSKVEVTRVFFSRHVWETERQSLRLGAGFHFIDVGLSIDGEATLDDNSTEFRASVVSASLPIPNIGAWYRYSPSEKWLLNARADWFSADVGEFAGGIWNAAVGANYGLTKNVGIGVSYQFFQIDGTIRKTGWQGDLRTRFDGPHIYVVGYW